MGKIPGKILIICGLAVIALSVAFNIIGKTNRFVLFIIIASFIVVWGIISVYLERKNLSPKLPSEEIPNKPLVSEEITRMAEQGRKLRNPHHEQTTHQTQSTHHAQSGHHAPHKTTHQTTACPNCGLKHFIHANYCQRCGTKLK